MSPWERGCHNPALQNTPRRLEIAPNFSLLLRSCLQLLQKVTTGQESATQFRCCNFCQGLARPSASPTSPRLFLPGHGFAKAPQNPQQLNTLASPSRLLSDLNCQHHFPSVYIMCFEKSREDSNSDFNFSLFLFEQIRADFSPVLLTPACADPGTCRQPWMLARVVPEEPWCAELCPPVLTKVSMCCCPRVPLLCPVPKCRRCL